MALVLFRQKLCSWSGFVVDLLSLMRCCHVCRLANCWIKLTDRRHWCSTQAGHLSLIVWTFLQATTSDLFLNFDFNVHIYSDSHGCVSATVSSVVKIW